MSVGSAEREPRTGCGPEPPASVPTDVASESTRPDREVRASEARKTAILESALDCVITIDHTGRVLELNGAAEHTFGHRRDDAIGRELADLIVPPPERDRHRRALARWADDDASGHRGALLGKRVEMTALRADGSLLPVELMIARLDLPGPPIFTATLRDISDRKAAEERLQAAELRYRLLIEQLPLITYVDALDDESSSIYTSPQVEELLGYTADEWRREPSLFVKTLHPHDRERVLVEHADSRATGAPLTTEYRMIARDGRTVWLRDGSIVLRDAGDNPVSRQGYLLDITERREAEEQLRHQAFHDPLTGLANRALFADRVEHAVAGHSRSAELGVAVLFLDIDDFKAVNDSLGHSAGDLLLKAVGQRLLDAVRPGDTVARCGGDEFAVLIEEISAEPDAARAAERIARVLRVPFFVHGREIFVTASIGISIGHHADELLRSSDVAMYRAKSSGKASYVFYEPAMDDATHSRLQLTSDLRRATFRGEFSLVYQPEVELSTGRPVGLEALLRWIHPELGVVAPLEFVGLAEDTGLVVPIGRWVLAEACARGAELRSRRADAPPLAMSLNLSARQLQDSGLVDDVSEALRASGFPPELLTLELTESVLVRGGETVSDALRALRELGVRLALDDFGTGYSSLSYLRDLPVEVLKIGRSFVAAADADAESRSVLRGIVQIGHALGLEVVAEGIERASQVIAALELGCTLGQGYHFWAPLEAHELHALPAPSAGCPSLRRAS